MSFFCARKFQAEDKDRYSVWGYWYAGQWGQKHFSRYLNEGDIPGECGKFLFRMSLEVFSVDSFRPGFSRSTPRGRVSLKRVKGSHMLSQAVVSSSTFKNDEKQWLRRCVKHAYWRKPRHEHCDSASCWFREKKKSPLSFIGTWRMRLVSWLRLVRQQLHSEFQVCSIETHWAFFQEGGCAVVLVSNWNNHSPKQDSLMKFYTSTTDTQRTQHCQK